MSKKPRKKGKQDRIASNAEWLNTSLESTPLDLDAIASMPIDEVNRDLKKYKAQTNASFVKALNEKTACWCGTQCTEGACKENAEHAKALQPHRLGIVNLCSVRRVCFRVYSLSETHLFCQA